MAFMRLRNVRHAHRNWPEASEAQDIMAAVSGESKTAGVFIIRFNSSCRLRIAFDVRIDFQRLFGDRLRRIACCPPPFSCDGRLAVQANALRFVSISVRSADRLITLLPVAVVLRAALISI
jgi:hypothetical protein